MKAKFSRLLDTWIGLAAVVGIFLLAGYAAIRTMANSADDTELRVEELESRCAELETKVRDLYSRKVEKDGYGQ